MYIKIEKDKNNLINKIFIFVKYSYINKVRYLILLY